MNADDAVLVHLATKELLPFYRGALSTAEGWPWQFKNRYKGALLVDELGSINEITAIKVLGPFGESVASKFFSLLNCNWRVELQLTEFSLSFDDLKRLIIESLTLGDIIWRTAYFVPDSNFVECLSGAASAKDIFECLHISSETLDGSIDEEFCAPLDNL